MLICIKPEGKGTMKITQGRLHKLIIKGLVHLHSHSIGKSCHMAHLTTKEAGKYSLPRCTERKDLVSLASNFCHNSQWLYTLLT